MKFTKISCDKMVCEQSNALQIGEMMNSTMMKMGMKSDGHCKSGAIIIYDFFGSVSYKFTDGKITVTAIAFLSGVIDRVVSRFSECGISIEVA